MDKRLRRARAATFAFFALNGFVVGMWLVHIAAVEHRAGITHSTLGLLLLLLGGGAFVGMQLAGPLADRFGAYRVVPVSALLCCLALVLPGLATSGLALGAGLLVLGFGNGALDVSMNAHAVEVEHAYGRPIMSAFHAVWSVGGFLAALTGSRTLSWGWAPALTMAIATGIALVVGAVATPALLHRVPKPVEHGDRQRRRTPGRIWALAGVAILLMLSEGVANDWSVLAAVGVLTSALAPVAPLAIVGWTLFGIGLSGSVPQLFSAAGHADRDNAGANVSRVAGLGYLGILAGPAIIGPMTNLMPLNLTFLLVVVFCVVAVAGAGFLSPATPADASPETPPSPPEHREAATPTP